MSVKRCPQCNLVNWATEFFCKSCGQDLQAVDFLQPAKVEMSDGDFDRIKSQNHFQNRSESPESHQFFGDSDKQHENSSNFNKNVQAENKTINTQKTNNQYSGNHYSRNFKQLNSKTKKGMAVASLVFGILGFPFVSIFLGGIISLFLALIFGTAGAIFGASVFLLMIPLSLILGIVAVARVNKMPDVYGGKSFAITGIIFSSCGILLLPVFGIIGAIAVPNLMAARKAANEDSAISAMRMIIVAEETYKAENLRCADLKTLGAEKMIDSRLVKGESNGYRFIVVNLPTINGDCAVMATPASTMDGAQAFYYSTEDGMIRARKYEGKPAGPTDEPIKITTAPSDYTF